LAFDRPISMKSTQRQEAIQVGVIGTGFIARQLFHLARSAGDLRIARALTRRALDSCAEVPDDVPLTRSTDELIEHSDVVVECSGDVIHATRVIDRALQAGRPVVTMNSEFHTTCGSHFVDRGYLTEAEGDQPGCTAALRRDVLEMGFAPLVYGNMKGFLNLDPEPKDMEYWAGRQGIRVHQTVSFTDGTKVQIEQAFLANAFNAGIAQPGLLAVESEDFDTAAWELAQTADRLGFPISDFIVSAGQAPGVFIVAKHDEVQRPSLRYLKIGDGPYYTLIRPFHLCGLEIPKTIRRVVAGDEPLINNSSKPSIGVAAVAKTDLKPGDTIALGVGSYKVRGRAVRMAEEPKHVPIGILCDAVITRVVERGEMLTVDDVDLPDSEARNIALGIVRGAAS
jgi:predicted homoserine dehydrogenase-like protein